MNLIIPLITLIIIVIIILIIIYIKYYKPIDVYLSIQGYLNNNKFEFVKLHQTIQLKPIEIEDFKNKLQKVDSKMKVSYNIDTHELYCTKNDINDKIELYLFTNSIIDLLINNNITVMHYNGTIRGKVDEILNCDISKLYTEEITDYKIVHVNENTNNDNNEDIDDISNNNIDNEDIIDNNNIENTNNEEELEKIAEQFSTDEYHSSEIADFVLYDNQNINAKIIFKNINDPNNIYVIEFPIYTYSAYNKVRDKINIILEPYKGLISSKIITLNEITYELHYQNDKNLKIDYEKIKKEIEKNIGTLMVYLNDQTYIYQTTDIQKLNRYIRQLKESKLKIIEGPYSLKAARIKSMKIFN